MSLGRSLPSELIEHRVKDVGGRLAYLRELRDGLRFVRSNALVLSIVLVATVTNFLDVPLLTVVLPVYRVTTTAARPASAESLAPSPPAHSSARWYSAQWDGDSRAGSPSS